MVGSSLVGPRYEVDEVDEGKGSQEGDESHEKGCDEGPKIYFQHNYARRRAVYFGSCRVIRALLFVFTILIMHSCIFFVFDPTARFVDSASIVFLCKKAAMKRAMKKAMKAVCTVYDSSCFAAVQQTLQLSGRIR